MQKNGAKSRPVAGTTKADPHGSRASHALESRKLRQFIAVAEELNFHRAAARLHMSQPPLSAAIKELESSLGVRLFDRGKKRVSLTPTGAAFLAEARLALMQVERAARVAREAEDGLIGRIRIGFSGSLAYGFLPKLLYAFGKKYPNIKVDIFDGTTLAQVEAVADGRIDIGFVRPPITNTGGLESKVVYRDRLIAVLPKGHRLATRASIDVKDLANEHFIASSGVMVPGLRAQIDRVCRAAGFAPKVLYELSNVPSIVNLVSGRLGVALVPGAARLSLHAGVVYKPLHRATADIDMAVHALWRKGAVSRPAANFLNLAGQ